MGDRFEKLVEIFHTLGSPAAMKILKESEDGLRSGRDTIDRLKLTSRAYYSNLKRLRSLGMIHNSGSAVYVLTPLGRAFRKIAIDEALPILGDNGLSSEGILDGLMTGEITIIDSCELLSTILGMEIERSRKETLMAIKCFDMPLAEKIGKSLINGLRIRMIFDRELDLSGLFRERKGVRGTGSQFMSDPHKNDHRIADVPLSFTIIDHDKVVFEVPTEEFNLALSSTNRKVVDSFIVLFRRIWSSSRLFQLDAV